MDLNTRIKGHNWPLQFRTHQFRALSYLRGLNSRLGTTPAYQASNCCSASFSKSLLLKLFPAAWSNTSRERLSRSPARWLRHTTRMHSTSFHTLLSWWASQSLGYLPNVEQVQQEKGLIQKAYSMV